MSSFPRLFFPVYYWHVELRLKCWPYFKVFFNDLWWKINAKPQTSKQTKKILIIFSICGICDSVLPFWITSHLHRKSSIKAVLLLFSMHSFDWLWHISGQPHSAFLYMPICLPSLSPSLLIFFSKSSSVNVRLYHTRAQHQDNFISSNFHPFNSV